MTKPPLGRVWHRGTPPSVGWWPASRTFDENTVAWWNGDYWSEPCPYWITPGMAEGFARMRADYQSWVMWRERPASWPARSRT